VYPSSAYSAVAFHANVTERFVTNIYIVSVFGSQFEIMRIPPPKFSRVAYVPKLILHYARPCVTKLTPWS
jgi:hypothetical protein